MLHVAMKPVHSKWFITRKMMTTMTMAVVVLW